MIIVFHINSIEFTGHAKQQTYRACKTNKQTGHAKQTKIVWVCKTNKHTVHAKQTNRKKRLILYL